MEPTPTAALTPAGPPHETPGTAPDAAAPHWAGQGHDWQLVLAGDWAAPLPAPPPELAGKPGVRVSFDSAALTHWEPPLAGALWQLLAPLARTGVQLDLSGLPRALQPPLARSLPGRSEPTGGTPSMAAVVQVIVWAVVAAALLTVIRQPLGL